MHLCSFLFSSNSFWQMRLLLTVFIQIHLVGKNGGVGGEKLLVFVCIYNSSVHRSINPYVFLSRTTYGLYVTLRQFVLDDWF
jgi:hypothetical protein